MQVKYVIIKNIFFFFYHAYMWPQNQSYGSVFFLESYKLNK